MRKVLFGEQDPAYRWLSEGRVVLTSFWSSSSIFPQVLNNIQYSLLQALVSTIQDRPCVDSPNQSLYHSRFNREWVAEKSQIFLRDIQVHQNYSAMRNTSDMVDGKPIAVYLRCDFFPWKKGRGSMLLFCP
jgi:hypothetical protein